MNSKPKIWFALSTVISCLLAAGALRALVASDSLAAWVFSPTGLETALIGLGIIVTLVMVDRHSAAAASARNQILALFVVLLLSEGFFVRWGSVEEAARQDFSPGAFGEAAVWLMVALGACTVLWKQGFPHRRAIQGSLKWLCAFSGFALLSAVYSETRLFSAVWAFKLVVTGALLLLYFKSSSRQEDVVRLLKALFWTFVVLIAIPLAISVVSGTLAFEDNRLSAGLHPVDMTEHAGMLILLGIVLHSLERRPVYLIFALLASPLALLSGGKMALAATLVSIGFFAFMRKRAGALMGLCGGAIAILLLAFSLSPAGDYARDYAGSGQIDSLSGRTDLWQLGWEAIKEKPLLGHGYLSSKFISLAEDVDWEAGHLHNAPLDVLYNLGIVGLLLLAGSVYAGLRAHIKVLRHCYNERSRLLAISSLTLLLSIFLTGITEASFGGRPGSGFMTFIALMLTGEILAGEIRVVTVRTARTATAEAAA